MTTTTINMGFDTIEINLVNLNYCMDICESIHDHDEEQIQTQKLVSGGQVTYHMIFITPLNIILFY